MLALALVLVLVPVIHSIGAGLSIGDISTRVGQGTSLWHLARGPRSISQLKLLQLQRVSLHPYKFTTVAIICIYRHHPAMFRLPSPRPCHMEAARRKLKFRKLIRLSYSCRM